MHDVRTMSTQRRRATTATGSTARPGDRERKTERLDVRVSREERALYEEAAAAGGRTVADFVREAASSAAGIVLADRTRFVVPPESWSAFAAAVDREPCRLPRLAALIEEPSILDAGT
jgi:uncharacterized protein (DUF1778 family)